MLLPASCCATGSNSMFHAIRPFLTPLLALAITSVLCGEDAKPVEGTLSLSGKPYKLQHAVAFETKVFGKPGVAILASDRAINIDIVKKALLETKDQPDVWLRQPHVRVTFDASGKILPYYASAPGFAANSGGDALRGEMKRDGDRVIGKAMLPSLDEGQLQRSFDFQFALGLVGSASESTQQPAPLA